ncbi:MAG: hypothetical protein JSS28_05635, partial [Proteobacteria bacterium]|nr:hypothetical protein [Pseudomonadota bacterium]
MRIATALFSALLVPAFALAQLPAPASGAGSAVVLAPQDGPQGETGDAGWRLPLWGTSDGRVLALVALGGSHGAPTLPQAPQIGSAADWQLIDVTHFVGGGLSLRLGNRVNAWAKFGRGIALTPLNTAAATLGCDAGLALALNEACPAFATPVKSGVASIGAGWSTDRLDFAADAGLAW